MKIFEEVLFFKLRTKEIQKKKKKGRINSTYLVSFGIGEASRRKWAQVSLVPFPFRQPPPFQMTQDKLNIFFKIYLFRTRLEKEDFLENFHVLSCLV